MLKVGLDISQVAFIGGVSTYTKNLAEQLAHNPELSMTYFYSSLRIPYPGNLKNVQKFKIPPTILEIMFNKIHQPQIETFLGPIDIFHSSDWTQPRAQAKKVTTYHDVIPLKYPQWSKSKIVAVHKRRLKWVEKEIDMVIAVSESTKQDLLEVSKIPKEKIVVIYEGVEEIFKPQSKDQIEKFKTRLNLPKKYILAIGGVGQRRNLERVKLACKGYDLVISGTTIPWVENNDLPLLYSGAEVLLYPSLYEGFGLPILEAMSCGTPVITSDVSSMPEVAGGAALLVNPESVQEVKKQLDLIFNDSKLRADLIIKGLSRAKEFSWETNAKQTAEVYKKLV